MSWTLALFVILAVMVSSGWSNAGRVAAARASSWPTTPLPRGGWAHGRGRLAGPRRFWSGSAFGGRTHPPRADGGKRF